MSEILTKTQVNVKAELAREVGSLPEVSVLVLCVSHEALRAEVARLTAALAQAREENGTLSRTVERLTQALNTLQSAARTFVASSDQLRAAQNVASPSALTLDSEREMNAILTAEVARLTAALAQAGCYK